MSAACPPHGSPSRRLGVSTTTGTPAIERCASSSAKGATPIEPSPIVVCRSRWTRTRRASRWRARGRAGRAHRGLERVEGRRHPARRGQVVPGRPRVAGVEADPDQRVVLEGGEVRPQLLDRRRQRLAATGGRLDQQPRPGRVGGLEHRQQPLVQLGQRVGVPVLADGGARVHDDALAAELRAAGEVVRDRGEDCSTVAPVGEPTFTRNGVWMNEGTPARRTRR